MLTSTLGFDYANLRSCTIKRKNFVLGIISLALSLTFVLIFLTFFIMYLLKVPMHNNGTYIYAGDPEYQSFFSIFLLIFGILSAVSILLGVIGFAIRPKTFMIVDEDENMKRFYYLYLKGGREQVYLTEDDAFIYRENYRQVTHETNPEDVHKLLDQYVFWRQFEGLQDYRLKVKRTKTVLRFKESTNTRFITLHKRYSFSNKVEVVPLIVHETVSIRTGGNIRTQAMHTFYFDDINKKPSYEIHPEIKKALSQMY